MNLQRGAHQGAARDQNRARVAKGENESTRGGNIANTRLRPRSVSMHSAGPARRRARRRALHPADAPPVGHAALAAVAAHSAMSRVALPIQTVSCARPSTRLRRGLTSPWGLGPASRGHLMKRHRQYVVWPARALAGARYGSTAGKYRQCSVSPLLEAVGSWRAAFVEEEARGRRSKSHKRARITSASHTIRTAARFSLIFAVSLPAHMTLFAFVYRARGQADAVRALWGPVWRPGPLLRAVHVHDAIVKPRLW